MDTDWCLSCNRHLDGVAGVYCSPECYDNDNPSSSAPSDIFEQSQYSHPPATSSSTNRWKGNDHAGILAWARDVSPGLPSEPSSSRDSSPRTPRPKLLDMHLQPLRPSLFVSSPRPAQPEPSKPILTPQSSDHAVFHRHSADDLSMTTSFLTESVVTPASSRFQSPAPQKPSVLGALATQVRTWVAPSANKPAPPPKRSPRDPSIQGLDPPFTVFARAHRGAVSPLAVPDEDLLPASKSGWDGREEDMLAGWFASQVEKKGNKMAVPTSRPPLDIAEHPAFRSRGRRTARAYAS